MKSIRRRESVCRIHALIWWLWDILHLGIWWWIRVKVLETLAIAFNMYPKGSIKPSAFSVSLQVFLGYSPKLTSLCNSPSSPLSKGKLSPRKSLTIWNKEIYLPSWQQSQLSFFKKNILSGECLWQWKIILQWDLSQSRLNLLSLRPSLPISWGWAH